LFCVTLFCVIPTALAAGPATRPAGNGGRDPSLPVDYESPVIRQMPAARPIKKLQAAPLYSFSERDVDAYLKFLHESEPDPIQRVVNLARKNIGQPYAIYLLGEFPSSQQDPTPLCCLEKAHCVSSAHQGKGMPLPTLATG